VRFREVLLPLEAAPGLAPFLRRHYPEFFVAGARRPPYFACPQIERFLRHAARLYERGEAIFIDYGDTRRFHLRAPERRRLVAGKPRSGASVYASPGSDDVTVMVDFSVVCAEAERAGWRVIEYGPQSLLARGTGVRIDAAAVETIARARALGWLMAALGRDPEQGWRRSALTWSSRPTRGGSLVASARRDVDEFLGARPSPFRLVRFRRAQPRRGERHALCSPSFMAQRRQEKRQKKKDGQGTAKKRRRMRANVASRQAAVRREKPSRDEVDTVKYKRGSAADRTRRGAP
jgi:hypothetical protein